MPALPKQQRLHATTTNSTIHTLYIESETFSTQVMCTASYSQRSKSHIRQCARQPDDMNACTNKTAEIILAKANLQNSMPRFDTCGILVRSSSNLKKHEREWQGSGEMTSFSCHFCKQSSKRANDYNLANSPPSEPIPKKKKGQWVQPRKLPSIRTNSEEKKEDHQDRSSSLLVWIRKPEVWTAVLRRK